VNDKVVSFPGGTQPTIGGVTLADLTLAATHLAISRALVSLSTIPNMATMTAEQRIQELAHRTGYVRGLLETANELGAHVKAHAAALAAARDGMAKAGEKPRA
jgi:hypothetical protein